MAGWIPPGDFYRRDGDTGIAEVGNGGKTGNPFSRSAGQTWNRMYPGGTSVESFSEIERAHVHKQRPENRGVFHASLMDKNQTREVRGHPEGELSVFYTSPRFKKLRLSTRYSGRWEAHALLGRLAARLGGVFF